jgi:glycosyltransferase involved in cell wall biosynthesis
MPLDETPPADSRPLVSVCMATYNGARYVEAQLRSILSELEPGDEVVVVDDASTDETVAVVEAIDDPRIRLHREPRNEGYVRTFEKAMTRARGDVVMLADQDDVWVPGRRRVLLDAATASGVAASNLVLLESGAPLRSPITRRPWRLRSSQSSHALRNEWRILAGVIPYFGCAMAVRRDVLARVLPFPVFLTESHDLWIATVANDARSMQHVDEDTVGRRLHDENASTSRPRSIGPVLRARWMLLRAWREASRRRRASSTVRTPG